MQGMTGEQEGITMVKSQCHIDSMVDNGGSREALGTEHAVRLAAFPNPKMHKAFLPREVLISKE